MSPRVASAPCGAHHHLHEHNQSARRSDTARLGLALAHCLNLEAVVGQLRAQRPRRRDSLKHHGDIKIWQQW